MCGAGIFVESLKLHQEWAPVWGAKCKELLSKIKDFSVCGAGIFVESLKLHQELALVWRAKCKGFLEKMKDFSTFGAHFRLAPKRVHFWNSLSHSENSLASFLAHLSLLERTLGTLGANFLITKPIWATRNYSLNFGSPFPRISLYFLGPIWVQLSARSMKSSLELQHKIPHYFEAALAGFVYRNLNLSMRTAQLSGFTFTKST